MVHKARYTGLWAFCAFRGHWSHWLLEPVRQVPVTQDAGTHLLCRPSEVDIVDTHLSLVPCDFSLSYFSGPEVSAGKVSPPFRGISFLYRSWPLPLPPPPRRLVFGAILSASVTRPVFRFLHPRRSVRSIGSFACLLLFCLTYRACPTCRAYGCHLHLCRFSSLWAPRLFVASPTPTGQCTFSLNFAIMSSQDEPMSDARFYQIRDAADGPLWAALTKDRSFASARQILSHNWKARWSTIRLENDLVKTLLDALAQHPQERALFVHNLAEMSPEPESEELPLAEAPSNSRG